MRDQESVIDNPSKPEVLRRQVVPVPRRRQPALTLPAVAPRCRAWLFTKTSDLAAAAMRLTGPRGDYHRTAAMGTLMREFFRHNGVVAPVMLSGDLVVVDDEDGEELRIRVGSDVGLRTMEQLGTAMLSKGAIVAAYYGPGHPANTPLGFDAYARELRLPSKERLVPITQDVELDKGRGLLPLAARTNRPPAG